MKDDCNEAVENRNTRLSSDVSQAAKTWAATTYNAQCTDKLFRGRVVVLNHLRDEICRHTDTSEEADDLKDPCDLEGSTQSAIVRSGHIGKAKD